MSKEGTSSFDEKFLLDWGTRIGAAARSENIRPAQLENLIASLDSFPGRESLLVVATFALRQAERLGTGRNTARLVSRAMLELYEMGAGKDDARKTLGFAKWVYEALTRGVRGNLEQLTLEQLLKHIVGERIESTLR